MIFGIGTDIFALDEAKMSVDEFGIELFGKQYCTQSEMNSLKDHKDQVRTLAIYLSIKEAVGKAFGTGLIDQLWFDDIEVKLSSSHSLSLYISEESTDFLEDKIVGSVFSLVASYSTTKKYVSATCIVSICKS